MKKLFFVFISVSLLILLTDCAKMGSLTGGIRDSLPPDVINSQPENYSVNFDRDQIEITFDEFITLTDINQELVVSPPLEERVAVKQKGKSIVVELNNELRENTTYTLNFGQSIKDNHEGNPLLNYEFVFSTGDYLDSLSVYGQLLNAFDLKAPEDPVNIMLYDNLNDSAFIKEIPVYIAKTGKEGFFAINNLKADTFRIYALKDFNNNFRFDLPNEKIAFLDTSLILSPEFFSRIVVDSLQLDTMERSIDTIRFETPEDSLVTVNDTLRMYMEEDSAYSPSDSIILYPPDTIPQGYNDTIDRFSRSDTITIVPEDSLRILLPADTSRIMEEKKPIDKILVDLFLFEQTDESRYITTTGRPIAEHLYFAFSLPVTDSFSFRSLQPPENGWYLMQQSPERDSFNLWITDTAITSMDSIVLEFKYTSLDTLDMPIEVIDTSAFFYRKPAPPPSRRKQKEEEVIKEPTMGLTTIKNKSTLELNEDVVFNSSYPIAKIDTSYIEFFSIPDSIEQRESYEIQKDSMNLLRAWLFNDWKSNINYHLQVFPQAFIDIYGHTNDTIDIRFKTREEDFYGTLILNVSGVECPVIVQLKDSKNEVVKSRIITRDGQLTFDFIDPAKYTIKFIHDCNSNGKWDTGNFLKGIQPEKVEFYEGEINVRSNWEMEVSHSLKYIL